MPSLQEASAGPSDWFPLTKLSTGSSESLGSTQQSNSNGIFDTTRLSPSAAQNLVSQPHTRSIATQTESIDSEPLAPNTPPRSNDTIFYPRSVSSRAVSPYSEETTRFHKVPPKMITVTPSPDRTVKRSLKGIHIFVCIARNLHVRNYHDFTCVLAKLRQF